jgi:hypothetical protein
MIKLCTPRRGRTLVDTEVQGSLLRKISLHWGLFLFGNCLALVIWIRLLEQPDADWGETFSAFAERFMPFLIITIAMLPAFVADTLRLTHRFAGPILRLRSALTDAAAGREVQPLQFRQNDFWREIAENFNNVMSQRATTSDASTKQAP